MCAASSSTTRSGGSSGRPERGRALERVGQDLLGQRGEIAAQPALVVGRRAQIERVGATEQIGRLERVGRRCVQAAHAAKGASTVSAVVYTELRVRSSRHHVARAASSASGGRGTFEDARPPRPPLACRPTAPRRPWCRPSSAAARRAGPATWPPWRTRTRRRPWSLGLGASHRSAADPAGLAPFARTRSSGDQTSVAAGAARGVDAPHPAARPSRRPGVAEEVALHAGRHAPGHASRGSPARPGSSSSRSAVGPTTTSDWAGLRGEPAGPRQAGQHAEEQTARRRAARPSPAADAGRAGWPSARRAGRRGPGSARRVPPARARRPAKSAPPSASGTTSVRLDPPRLAAPSWRRRCRRCAAPSR